jgi:hypothetical protein
MPLRKDCCCELGRILSYGFGLIWRFSIVCFLWLLGLLSDGLRVKLNDVLRSEFCVGYCLEMALERLEVSGLA